MQFPPNWNSGTPISHNMTAPPMLPPLHTLVRPSVALEIQDTIKKRLKQHDGYFNIANDTALSESVNSNLPLQVPDGKGGFRLKGFPRDSPRML